MPVLPQNQSRASLSRNGNVNTQLSDAVGRGIASLGGAISSVGGRMMERQQQKEDFKARAGFERLQLQLSQDMEQAEQNISEDGTGFHDRFLSTSFEQRQKSFMETLPDRLKEEYGERLLTARENWSLTAAKKESAQEQLFYKNEISTVQDDMLKQISMSPGAYDDYYQRGADMINASRLTALEKKAALDDWRARSAETRELAKIEQFDDYSQNIRSWGGDTSTYSPADIAKTFVGKNESKDTAALNEFIKRSAGIDINVQNTAWCAAFVNAMLGASGVEGNGSLSARSFLEYGKPVEKPEIGDIVVLSRGDPNGPFGHVGFYAGEGANGKIKILGGNQGGRSQGGGGVTVADYDASRVLGYRQPPKATGTVPPKAPANAYVPKNAPVSLPTENDDLSFEGFVRVQNAADAAVKRREAATKAVGKEVKAQQTAAYDASLEELKFQISDGSAGLEQIEMFRRENPDMDYSDYDKLRTELKQAEKARSEADRVESILNTGGSLNIYESEDRKALDKVYNDTISALPEEQREAGARNIVKKSGYAPDSMVKDIRSGLVSQDDETLLKSIRLASDVLDVNPNAFAGRDGAAGIAKAVEAMNTYERLGYSEQEGLKRYRDSQNVEIQQKRKAILNDTEIKKWVKETATPDEILDSFDQGIFDFAPDFMNDSQGIAAAGEFGELLEDALVETGGDRDAAKSIATQRFQKIYGQSEMNLAGNEIVMRFPPEKYYPEIDGGHQYIIDEVKAIVMEENPNAKDVFLQPDAETEADIRAGRPPRYQIWFTDENGMIQQMYGGHYVADIEEATKANNKKMRERYQRNQRTKQIPGLGVGFN